MARKKWTPLEDITPEVIAVREKKKWQIALRRYVIEENPSVYYAPFFGLDVQTMRKWFEDQFYPGYSWGNFGKEWQFEHIIPVTYFDFSNQQDLKLCWNFTNLTVSKPGKSDLKGSQIDLVGAKNYFLKLYELSGFLICRQMADKITQIEAQQLETTSPQQLFIISHREFLQKIKDYSEFEFDLLNNGKTPEEIRKASEPFEGAAE
jgi:hypothetical protein